METNKKNLILGWEEKFRDRRVQHINRARLCRYYDLIFGGISILFSIIGSIFSTILTAHPEIMSKTNAYLINMLLHFFVLFLTSIRQFYNFRLREKNHLQSSHNFSNLLREIELIETLPESEQDLELILNKYSNVTSNEPMY